MTASMWRFINPGFYVRSYRQYIANLSPVLKAGSGVPFVQAMVLTGVIGYSMEYTQVGRFHVLEKQKIIEEAMKNHHH